RAARKRSGSPTPSPTLIEIATITARGLACQPMKRGGEGARLAEADLERDRGDGQLTIRQQLLGPFDSAVGVISVRRHAEGALERPGEMVRAQPRQLGEGREGNIVGDILLDIGGHPLLLPARKAAKADRAAKCTLTVDANEFVRQRDAERFGVLPLHRARVLDQRLELESGLPETAIVKEQARLEFDLAEPQRGIGERPARIDVEIGCTRQRARSLRSAEIMPGRNEGQLLREIAQGRPGQAFNKGLTVVALRELCSNEQMAGSPESIFERRAPRDLNRFHVQARPGLGMASDYLRWRNVDKRARFK